MSNPFEQQPLAGEPNPFAENSEQRCPCLLLLDVSGSMRGEPLNELNEGLIQFKDELYADSLASKRIEIGVVTFGPVTTVNDFTGVQTWDVPRLTSQGDTPMGRAIEEGLAMLRRRKDEYKAHGVTFYRPWVFLITDGGPTDAWADAARLVHEGENKKAFKFFAVGVKGANMEILSQISVSQPLQLKELRFRDLFQWLSSSLSSVSRSTPGDAVPLQNPAAPSGWALV